MALIRDWPDDGFAVARPVKYPVSPGGPSPRIVNGFRRVLHGFVRSVRFQFQSIDPLAKQLTEGTRSVAR